MSLHCLVMSCLRPNAIGLACELVSLFGSSTATVLIDARGVVVSGHALATFILVLGVVEQVMHGEVHCGGGVVQGLAILVVYFRNRGSIAVEDINLMKG